jgi:hypothetical protein
VIAGLVKRLKYPLLNGWLDDSEHRDALAEIFPRVEAENCETLRSAWVEHLAADETIDRIAAAIYRSGVGKHPCAKPWSEYGTTAHGEHMRGMARVVAEELASGV